MENSYTDTEQSPFYKRYTSLQEINEDPFWMTVLDDIYCRMFDKYKAKYNPK